MTVERRLQTCIAAMAALGTLLLGTSQESSTLPVVAIVAAGSALIFTDVLAWFHLNRYVAGLAGLIAVWHAFLNSRTGGVETQFISVANLLIHLQIILLFQVKTLRVYWQLIVLSLLQVVVAAALNLFFLFGVLLVLYAGFAIAALLLLFIFQATQPYVQPAATPPRPTGATGSTDVIQLEGQQVAARVSGCSEGDPRFDLLRRSFWGNVGSISFMTSVVAAAVFILMPRLGNGVWRATSYQQTGYSGEVDLDDELTTFEDRTVVMRVTFEDEWRKEPYILSDEPYLRGRVLDRYEARRGRWGRDREVTRDLVQIQRPTSIVGVVRQSVTIERKQSDVIFNVSPTHRLDATPQSAQINETTHEVVYQPRDEEDPAQYAVGSTAFRNGFQSEFVPVQGRVSRESRNFRQVRDRLPQLSALADQIVADVNGDATNVLNNARRLEAHFSSSGLYRYSLDPSPDRNPRVDPVEDFVSNHRTGHCQHFASALALMLRSQDIPSRVVVGYRGGVFNAVGNYFQVREMDAHAWVEAFISQEALPADEILPTDGLPSNAWVRLDPTPGGDVFNSVGSMNPWVAKLNDAVDYLQLLWSEYVLGLNQKRQRQAIYQPLVSAVRSFSEYCFSANLWAERWEAVRARFRGGFFTRQTAIDAGVAIVTLTIAFYVFRFVIRWFGRGWSRVMRRRSTRRQVRVEFYRRLESVLRRHGIRRGANQTAREFALQAGQTLAQRQHPPPVTSIPARVVDFFYRVRFGHDELPPEETQRVDKLLRELQHALQQRRPRAAV